MAERVVVISGASRGIGRHLAEHYCSLGDVVVGCSRSPVDSFSPQYQHHTVDVADEKSVQTMFAAVRKEFGRVDVVINNAGIASMNAALLTPIETAQRVIQTNFIGSFLFCREAARLMRRVDRGRMVNFSTVAVPLQLEGEAIYASSKAAVVTLTQVLAREFATMGITVNAVGPTPIDTDLIRGVPQAKIQELLDRQAISRLGTFDDVTNVIDFFLKPASDFITGQTIYLGGVS